MIPVILLMLSFGRSRAVQNEADLQFECTSAITAAEANPSLESGSPIDYDFTPGRATNYA